MRKPCSNQNSDQKQNPINNTLARGPSIRSHGRPGQTQRPKRNLTLAAALVLLLTFMSNAALAAVSSVTVGAQSATIAPGGSPTFTVTASGTDAATVTFDVTGLPTGATASFDANPVLTTDGAWTTNVTLTITTTADVVPGSYAFTVGATPDASGTVTGNGTLLVLTATTTAVSSSANPDVYGDATLTFTATVTTTGAGTPTGSVNFMDGATVLATGTVTEQGTAIYIVPKLSAAASPHAITAVYAGDTSFQGSTSAVLSQAITPAGLTVSGITAASRVYDGTTAAAVDASGATLAGMVEGDNVSLDISSTAGAFADKNVGTDKSILISGLALTGTDAANYSLTAPTATASITGRALVITATGVDKVYDGTTAATVTLSDNRVSGDELAVGHTAAVFADRNVGPAKAINVTGITVTGTDAGNYLFTDTAAAQAVVTARGLIVTAVADAKAYDGTTASAGVPALSGAGLATGDTAAFIQSFDTKDVGAAKVLAPAGAVTDGNAGNNYAVSLVTANTGAITPASLTVKADDKNKAYGANNPNLTATYSGFVGGDTASVVSGSPELTTTAEATSPAGEYPITAAAGSLSAANYSFVFANGTLTVGKAVITVRADDTTRAYGEKNPVFAFTYSGFVNGDNAAIISGAPVVESLAETNSPVANSPYAITVAAGSLSAANYTFSFAAGQLTVTQAVLTVTADTLNKVYGAELPTLTSTTTGFVNAEDSTVVTGAPELSTTSTATSGVGAYDIVLAKGTLSAENYSFALVNGKLNVTPATLTASVAVSNKVYDGTVEAAIAERTLSALAVNGDEVQLSGGTAVFADKAVAAGKEVTVTGLTLSGAQAGNYALASTTLTATASITGRPLVITATGVDKVYDGTTAASVTLSDNRVPGDVLTVGHTAAVFADRNVGPAKAISVTGITVTGTDAANYLFGNTAVAQAAITARALLVTAVADTKVYDGTTASAGVPGISGAGLVSGDTAHFTQRFETKDVGAGKVLTPAGAVTDGNAGNNYAAVFVSVNTGLIAPANLTITADNKTKVVGTANPVLTATYTGFVGGDTESVLTTPVTLSTTAKASSPVGVYPINASGASAQNYMIAYEGGILTVASQPSLTSIGKQGDLFVFSFPSATGLQYQVEACDDLDAAVWAPVGNPVQGTGETLTVSNTITSTHQFFRLSISPSAK